MNKHRANTFDTLARMGISYVDICKLVRASATLHTWHEHECNGALQQDEVTGKWYWYNTNTGNKICRTSDREKGARIAATRAALRWSRDCRGVDRGLARIAAGRPRRLREPMRRRRYLLGAD